MGTAVKHPVSDWVKPSFVIFDIHSAQMSKITNDSLTLSAVFMWQQWASKGQNTSDPMDTRGLLGAKLL